MDYLVTLKEACSQGIVPEKQMLMLRNFCKTYLDGAVSNGWSREKSRVLLEQFLELIIQQVKEPYQFESFHRGVKEPFNYYQFGIELIRPLIKLDQTGLLGDVPSLLFTLVEPAFSPAIGGS